VKISVLIISICQFDRKISLLLKCSASTNSSHKRNANQNILRFHLTPVKRAIIKNTTTNLCWQGCGGKGTLIHCWWECKLVQLLWKKNGRLLKSLNIDLPHDLAAPLLMIYPKECDTGYCKGTMFIAVLFIIAKLWKQTRCPTTDEWIKTMYLYTMEFYSAMKKNEILSLESNWMELENIILSEVCQIQKTKNGMFSLICGL
jgi:hypothetical protein